MGIWDEFKHLRWPKGTGQGGQFKGGGEASTPDEHRQAAKYHQRQAAEADRRGDGQAAAVHSELQAEHTRKASSSEWAQRISDAAGARHAGPGTEYHFEVDPNLGKRDLLAELDSDAGVSSTVDLSHFDIPARRRALESEAGLSSRDDTIEHWAQTLRDEQGMHDGGNVDGGTPNPAGDAWAQGISDRYDAAHALSEAAGVSAAGSGATSVSSMEAGAPGTAPVSAAVAKTIMKNRLKQWGVEDTGIIDAQMLGVEYPGSDMSPSDIDYHLAGAWDHGNHTVESARALLAKVDRNRYPQTYASIEDYIATIS